MQQISTQSSKRLLDPIERYSELLFDLKWCWSVSSWWESRLRSEDDVLHQTPQPPSRPEQDVT